MAVTAFIKRLRRHAGPTDQELGLDLGGSQVPLAALQSSHNNRSLDDQKLALSFLQSIYQPLKRHFEWFRRTQRGQLKQYGRKARSRTEAYRWRGRSQMHILTSGMDDYPRAPPHTGELHLDLLSWMGFFSRTMKEIAEFIGEDEDRLYYTNIEKGVINNIDGPALTLLNHPVYPNYCCKQIYTGAKNHRCTVTLVWMMTVRLPGFLDNSTN